jgi:hypothetical protein
MIIRRAFIAGLGVVAAMPFAAHSQQGGSMRRIGVLMAGTATDAAAQSRLQAFIDTLGKAGGSKARTSASTFATTPLMHSSRASTRRS